MKATIVVLLLALCGPHAPSHASIVTDVQALFASESSAPTEEQVMAQVDQIIDIVIARAEQKIWDKYRPYVIALLAALVLVIILFGVAFWRIQRNRRRLVALMKEVNARANHLPHHTRHGLHPATPAHPTDAPHALDHTGS
jgi:hypothetical protein